MPYDEQDLAQLAVGMCYFASECIGQPARTSLKDHWHAGDILFSAEWLHEGWIMDVGYYSYHPIVDDGAVHVWIKRARPGRMLKLVHSNMPEPVL